ncbi:MAG: aminotransferase class I/II-fold pyridoxal phosphate-dependent enzyme [Firmicutes bacterium]|nr:aminotransferase class I/II-fold pyridoxal phosphate-dependent enzyme [Bacillota bacterium]
MKILDYLNEYYDRDIYPMHMPGHKRRFDFLNGIPAYKIDLTEVAGSDNLHDPHGILKASMDMTSRLFNSYRSWYLINGSTCGLISAIFALSRRGDKILMARNCHKSVYNAVHICGLQPIYLFPPVDESFGVNGSITPEQVRAAVEEYPDIKLAMIVSPTYDGVISDIASISRILHERNIPLIVDEAHGPHLGFHPSFPRSAVTEGADLVIQSIHKTLPCPTQTALLHMCSSLWKNREKLEEMDRQVSAALAIFESTSPSYIFMAAMDNCIHLLNDNKESLFHEYIRRINVFARETKALKYIRVLCKGEDSVDNHPLFYAYDPSKIVMSIRNLSLTSAQFESLMLQRYKIELEMIAADYGLALTSICDTDEGFERLLNALLEIDAEYGREVPKPATPPPVQEVLTRMTISAAKDMPDARILLSESEGRVSREIIFAYPPGIPLVVPGEEITESMIARIQALFRDGITVQSSYGELPQYVHVVEYEIG